MQAATELGTILKQLLSSDLELEAPAVAGALTVFPIMGSPAKLDVVAFADAVEEGASAKELPGGASVNDLLIHNPTARYLLLVDGEEVLGAQQNRVFDGTHLVAPGESRTVAVCCVEQGRWDGRRRRESFTASRQVADPSLRRDMCLDRSRSVDHRTVQTMVWARVAETVHFSGVASHTTALNDVYVQRDETLEETCAQIPLRPGQLGMLVFLGGRFAALDWVGHPDAFERLHPRLLRGYALKALDRPAPKRRPGKRKAQQLLDQLVVAPVRAVGDVGRAQNLAVGTPDTEDAFTGTGLAVDGELLHVSVFPG